MKKKTHLLVLLIVLIGAVLRLYQLGDIPWALNRDEASIGYNAYSLLKTGTDEHGTAWPINVESFGDWKLPVYMYAAMPAIAFFGLESWVVRLPSALAGVTLIIASYYFVTAFRNKSQLDVEKVGLLTALLVAISPWSLRLSRVAYEANLALLLAVLGSAFLFRGLHTKQRWHIIPGLLLCFTTLLTYHAYQVFIPLFLFVTALLYWKTILAIFRKNKPVFVSAVAIALTFAGILYVGNTSSANTTKFSGLSVFSEETYHYQLYDARMMFEDPSGLPAKIYANSGTMIIGNLVDNFAQMVSPNFLVLNGGSHGSHDVPGIGNMYGITALLVIITLGYAVYSVLAKQKRPLLVISVLWLVVSFVAPIITVEAAHSIRFSPALVAIEVLAAIGVLLILHATKTRITKSITLATIAVVLLFSVVQTIGTYFVVFPQRDHHKWPWYSQHLSADLAELKGSYSKIIMPQVDSSPYIFLLFDWKYDPTKVPTNVEYYPTDSGGFRHAQRLENIYFEPIDWQNFVSSVEPQLVFIEENEFSKQNLASGDYTVVKTYTANNSQSTYLLVSN